MINPFACAGRALRVWRKSKDILEKGYIEMTVLETEYAGHAKEYSQEMNLDSFDKIVTCSGDGLIHEIINGLLNREDKAYLKNPVPFGVLPGGTSDGLGKTILEMSGEAYGLENQILCILRGKPRKIDLCEIEFRNRSDRVYSFLLMCFGMLSDIDLESEVLRCLGDSRLWIWALWRSMKLRRYNITFSYIGEEIENRKEYSGNLDLRVKKSVDDQADSGE